MPTDTDFGPVLGAADDLEGRLAREDAEAARVAILGEEYAEARYWKLHVRAKRLGHKLWAAKFMELFQVARAHLHGARVEMRAAVEQLAKLEERKKAKKAAPFTEKSVLLAVQARASDEGLLPEFVRLIQGGEVTKTTAAKLGIGAHRAKRVRALAVRRGLLPARR